MSITWAKFVIEGLLGGTLGLFGVFGNLVSIKVLSSKDLDMTPTFRHLLKMLAAFDATFLTFTVSLFCVSAWSAWYNDFVRPQLTPYFLPVIQIALTGSVWTTMAVSIERYVTVCLNYRPMKVQHMFYTVPILLGALLFNIPRFFELKTVFKERNVTITEGEGLSGEAANATKELYPEVAPTDLRLNPSYSRDYVLLVNSFALAFIPVAVLIILNGCIYRTIAKATRLHNAISSNQRRDHKVAMMLLVIVIVFICCHSIRSIINTYECAQMAMYGELRDWPDWIQFLVQVNHLALVVNSSINILIYACKDEKFLRVLLVTIRLRPESYLDELRAGGRRGNRRTQMAGRGGVRTSASTADDLATTHVTFVNGAESSGSSPGNGHRIAVATTPLVGSGGKVMNLKAILANGSNNNGSGEPPVGGESLPDVRVLSTSSGDKKSSSSAKRDGVNGNAFCCRDALPTTGDPPPPEHPQPAEDQQPASTSTTTSAAEEDSTAETAALLDRQSLLHQGP